MSNRAKAELKVEIAICKIIVKELQALITKYSKQVEREKEKEKKLMMYEDLEEAREAYGYGEMTEKEFLKIQDYFENKEGDKSVKELYLNHIEQEYKREKRNLRDLENELQEVLSESNKNNN